MSLVSFKVTDIKGLRLAECSSVPPLMIICGPNGSGKSTLLDAVKRGAGERVLDPPDTDIMYQPPHRAIRRQSVQRRWLGGAVQRFGDLLRGDSVGAFEGLQVPYPQRSPDNVDESGSTIKFVLGKLENKRQSYIASRVDTARRAGSKTVEISSMPDIFFPLSEVVSRLLPHLAFERVDFENEDNVRCVFIRTAQDGTTVELDLDDLSSGEKAVILLFLPLIEAGIHERLEGVAAAETEAADVARDRLFLLDEPEQHLHPDLQRRMLAFMRERSAAGRVQFVLVTHSPTILDEAGDDELYVLRLASAPTVNQLRKVASAGERLEALRELTGESYFVATGRNIACVEGEPRRAGREGASDLSIIEVLHPRASRYTFLAMGSRTQVETAVERLRAGLPAEEYGVAVAGLVDGDRTETVKDGVVCWSVCEFENLLLDPPSIVVALEEIGEPETVPTGEKVEEILKRLAESRRDEEVRLRVHAALPVVVFRPRGATTEELMSSFEAQAEEARKPLAAENLDALRKNAETAVDKILRDGTYASRFKGKALLRGLYNELPLTTVSYEQFCYAVAQQCKDAATVKDAVDAVFTELDRNVDEQLATAMLA
jgi:predicted ATPase